MFYEFFDYLKTDYFLVFFIYASLLLLLLYLFLWLLRFFVSLFTPHRRLPKPSRSYNISDIYQDPWDIPDIDVD